MEDSFSVPLVGSDKFGGPFDHRSYIAGCQIGLISARLAVAKGMGLTVDHFYILKDNLKQADLLAMNYGAVICCHELNPEYFPEEHQDWVYVGFQWAAQS
jgi:hypothetical protein